MSMSGRGIRSLGMALSFRRARSIRGCLFDEVASALMTTIACVLRSGGWTNAGKRFEYLPEHVLWLRKQIEDNATTPYRFVCLSDLTFGTDIILLKHKWPGWWSKMELFRPGLFEGRVFYIDLDTAVVGNIDDLLRYSYKRFTVLKNLSGHKGMGSGVMGWRADWRGDFSFLYEAFLKDPEGIMAQYTSTAQWGDQGFIQDQLNAANVKRDYWQELFPGAIKSFKFDLNRGSPGPETKLVCYHGRPKPWEIP